MATINLRHLVARHAGLILLAVGLGFPPTLNAGQISYVYDVLGRVTQATYPGAVVIRYSYDLAGNRTSYIVSGSPNGVPGGTPPVGGFLRTPGSTAQPTNIAPSQAGQAEGGNR